MKVFRGLGLSESCREFKKIVVSRSYHLLINFKFLSKDPRGQVYCYCCLICVHERYGPLVLHSFKTALLINHIQVLTYAYTCEIISTIMILNISICVFMTLCELFLLPLPDIPRQPPICFLSL